jgi:hypothetical protein
MGTTLNDGGHGGSEAECGGGGRHSMGASGGAHRRVQVRGWCSSLVRRHAEAGACSCPRCGDCAHVSPSAVCFHPHGPVWSSLRRGYYARVRRRRSGDDMTNVCRDASMSCMRRKIAGKTPEQIRALSSSEVADPVTQEDLEGAITRISPSVSKARTTLSPLPAASGALDRAPRQAVHHMRHSPYAPTDQYLCGAAGCAGGL